MVGEDAAPRLVGGLGQRRQGGVRGEAEPLGHLVRGHRPQHLGLADLLQRLLDVAGRVDQPLRAAAGEDQTLHLELVREVLEQLALAPQDLGQLVHVVGPSG